jgi:ligand-binding SRPBCC domain-containing protein
VRHTFQTAQWVPYPVDRVFAFFANPQNLPRLMPSWQMPRIEESTLVNPPPENSRNAPQIPGVAAGAGSRMTITFQALPLLPLRMKWEAAIVEFEWNHHFCDEQPKGPFAYWRHCHRVSEEEDQSEQTGTRVVDHLVYELPFGLLAEPVHALFVRGQIEAIFRYRQQRLLELLG